MLAFRLAALRKKLLTVVEQWRIVAVIFGLVLTVAWFALLARGALLFLKLV
jgi:hypothetical protein